MNGIHDMGGMDGFGTVDPDESGPVFHGKWEGQVMAASRVMGAVGGWNIDQGRYGIEQLPPPRYLTSYYHRWLARCEWALVTYGYADADEIAAGRALRRLADRLLAVAEADVSAAVGHKAHLHH